MQTVTVYRNKDNGDIYFEDDLKEMFDEFLDEPGSIRIVGIDYDRSRILKEVDPIAYRETFFAFIDGEYDELEIPWEVYVDNDKNGIREFIEDQEE